MKSAIQEKARHFASKHGYKLRKLKEGRVKVTRPDKTEIVVHDFSSAYMQMVSEVYKDHSKRNIFDF